jgi:hypothetical protein
MITDVLFIADHFVMVTTIDMPDTLDQRDVEKAAWKRLADEYGDDWVETTKGAIKQVSIEVVQQFPNVPEVGDITDTGTEADNYE